MNVEYIKDYKYKELKQYVLAYLLIAVASVGFYIKDTIDAVGLLSALSSMIAIDTLAGAICALVLILNEFWPDKVKQQIIYKDMPSDTVFTDIASGKIKTDEPRTLDFSGVRGFLVTNVCIVQRSAA